MVAYRDLIDPAYDFVPTDRLPPIKGRLSDTWRPGPDADWSRVRRASDVELARFVVAGWRSRQPVAFCEGTFWFYQVDEGHWEPASEPHILRQIHDLDGRPYGEVDDKGKRRTLTLSHAKVRSICATIAVELAETAHPHNPFSDAPVGLSLKGGFLTVEATRLVLYPHHPNWFQTTALGIDHDHKATCPLWRKSLDDWFGHQEDGLDQIALLQEFFGAALFGLAPAFGRALFLVGSGGQGKSQITRVLEGLFPTEKVGSVPPQRWQKEYAVDRLAHIALNVVNELPSAAIMEGATFKAVITGDSVYARPIYGQPYAFKPKAAHLFSTNQLPRSLDASDGFWRRILLLRMTRQFRNLEGAQEGHVDQLAEVILENEREGVLAWAVDGVQRLLTQEEYTVSRSARREVERWRMASDPIRQWLEERTSSCQQKIHQALQNEVWRDWQDWSERNGYQSKGRGTFLALLEEQIGEPARTNRGKAYPISLRREHA